MMTRRRSKKLKKSVTDHSHSSVRIPTNIEEAIDYLQLNDDVIRHDGLRACVNIICSSSMTAGLSNKTLTLLVDIIGNCKFSVAVSKKLIFCLRPMSNFKIPEDAILSALSWVCTRKMSLSIQILLLQWIVASYTFDIIDTTIRLHAFYNVVFCLLQYEELCPQVCHLLFLLTQKENVTIYHIQKLITLQSRLGSQPYTIGLLHMFQQLRPDYLNIQPKPLKCFHISNHWKHLQRDVGDQIPLSVDIRLPVITNGKKTAVKYEHLVSLMESLKNVASVLKSRHKRLLLTFSEDAVLKLILQFMLRINYEWSENNHEKCRELLTTMANILSETHEELAARDYVACCLSLWDGNQYFSEILGIIPYLLRDLNCSDDLSEILDVLHTTFCTSRVAVKTTMLDRLSHLFKNIVLFKYLPMNLQNRDETTVQDLQAVILRLAYYIDNLCIIGSMQHPENESTFAFAALDFYSFILHLLELRFLDLLLVPSISVVCTALFSFSACHLSYLCQLLTRYMKVVSRYKDSFSDTILTKESIEVLNNYFVEVSNVLWRCRGFVPTIKSSIFKYELPGSVKDTVVNPRDVFAAYRHPALLVLAEEYLQRVKERNVHIKPRDINSNRIVRNSFLQSVSQYKYDGIILFLQTFLNYKGTP